MQTFLTTSKTLINSFSLEKEKGFLFGIHASVTLTTKCIALIIAPIIANDFGLEKSILFTLILTFFSLSCAFMTYFLEEKTNKEKKIALKNKNDQE